MTDQERLEQIKNRLTHTFIHLARQNGKTQLLDDIQWLIKQAEKAVSSEVNNNQINEWVAMSQIAESSMKTNGYTVDDVHSELKEMRSGRNSFENIREKFQNQMKNKGVSYADVLESIENDKIDE